MTSTTQAEATSSSSSPAPLTWRERRFYAALGAPALGLAMVVTVISTYVPVLVAEASGPVLVGLLIAGEGFFGIFLPALVGAWSDRHARRVRDRAPLLVVFGAMVVGAMVLTGLLAGLGVDTAIGYAVTLVIAYAGYYAFLAPFWSLYADLVPDEHSDRSRSAEGTLRVIGVGIGLVAGGLLLDLWPGLPFIGAAAVAGVCITILLINLRGSFEVDLVPDEDHPTSLSATRDLLRVPGIWRMCLSEGLWNFALSALRAFVVLFFTIGLGRSSTFVSTVIFPLVAVGIAIAAPTAGWVAGKVGTVRLLLVASAVYAVGMSLPAFTRSSAVIAVIPVVAAGAAVVMTLPFAVLMRLIPASGHGVASGLFGFSRGLGSTLGPIVTGVAILLAAPVFDATQGYAVMWLVCSAALLLTVPLMWSMRHHEQRSTAGARRV